MAKKMSNVVQFPQQDNRKARIILTTKEKSKTFTLHSVADNGEVATGEVADKHLATTLRTLMVTTARDQADGGKIALGLIAVEVQYRGVGLKDKEWPLRPV